MPARMFALRSLPLLCQCPATAQGLPAVQAYRTRAGPPPPPRLCAARVWSRSAPSGAPTGRRRQDGGTGAHAAGRGRVGGNVASPGCTVPKSARSHLRSGDHRRRLIGIGTDRGPAGPHGLAARPALDRERSRRPSSAPYPAASPSRPSRRSAPDRPPRRIRASGLSVVMPSATFWPRTPIPSANRGFADVIGPVLESAMADSRRCPLPPPASGRLGAVRPLHAFRARAHAPLARWGRGVLPVLRRGSDLMRAPEALRCFSQAAISQMRRSRSPMRRSRHWPRSTPISISTMFSQLACLGV